MNPFLLRLLLMRYQQMMSGQGSPMNPRGRQSIGASQGRASYAQDPNNIMSNNPMTPGSASLLNALYQDFLNKGGGFVGNDIVGGGGVFQGFNRGGQQVGNVNFLRGDAPWMGLSPNASMERMFGPGGSGAPLDMTNRDPNGRNVNDPSGMRDFFNNIGGMGGELQGVNQYF